MRVLFAATMAVLIFAGKAWAGDPPSCAVPDYLLFGENSLKRVAVAVAKQHEFTIAVVGSGSSTLAGPDGSSIAYPARLESALNQKLQGVSVKVVGRLKSGQTAEDMHRNIKSLLVDEKPDLVIWQTGTVDAMRRIDPDDFRATLEEGVAELRSGGADVILMNMQYSPRTESMIAIGPYADNMRAVAQQRELPLFDRFAIMHYWAEEGAFDFSAASRDNALARRVHDCIGRAVADLIIDSAQLHKFESKAVH
jgi:lysophospholipase L1-like esterase